MKPRWRFVAVVLIAAALCLGSALIVAWHVHRVLQQTSAAINAEENFAADVRPVDLASIFRFDWLPAPAVFSAGAPASSRRSDDLNPARQHFVVAEHATVTSTISQRRRRTIARKSGAPHTPISSSPPNSSTASILSRPSGNP